MYILDLNFMQSCTTKSFSYQSSFSFIWFLDLDYSNLSSFFRPRVFFKLIILFLNLFFC